MPHLILEYTDNVEFDSRALFKALHETFVDSGAVRMKGLKSRAHRLTDYYLADGKPDYKMVHLLIVLREGRTREVKEDLARRAMAVLDQTFGHYRDSGVMSLSTDMKELEWGLALTNNNMPTDL